MGAAQQKYAESPRGKYTVQKAHAKRRGIPFEFTFEQWWNVWSTSGKYEQMGRGLGCYCMCRVGDAGSYAVGNVYIGTMHQNLREQAQTAAKLDPDALKKLMALRGQITTGAAAKLFGLSQSYVSRLWSGQRGKYLTTP